MANQNTPLPAARPKMAQCWLLWFTEPVTEGLDPKPEAHRLTGRGARRLPALTCWLPGTPACSVTASTPRTPSQNLKGTVTVF